MKVNKLFLTTMLTCLPLYVMARETTPNDTLPHSWSDTILINRSNHGFMVDKRMFDQPVSAYMASPSGDYEMYVFQQMGKKGKKNNYRVELHRAGDNAKLWARSFKAPTCSYRMTPYGVFEEICGRIQMLRYTSGATIWKASSHTYSGCVDDHFFTRDPFKGLCAYSLRTGKKEWNTRISYAGGLNYSQMIDTNHDFLVADNIYKIDWRSGDTKQIKAKTHIKNNDAIANSLVLTFGSATLAAIIGYGPVYYFEPYGYTRKVKINKRGNLNVSATSGYNITGIASNIVRSNGRNYFADRNSVVCFDDDMNEIWRTNVDSDDKMSRSTLLLTHDKLFVISIGDAVKDGKFQSITKPSIAAYQTSDGMHIFTKKLREDKTSIRADYGEGYYYYIMFEDEMFALNTVNNRVSRINYNADRYGKLSSFLSKEESFIKDDNAFYPLCCVAKHIPVKADNGNCIDIDAETGNVKFLCDAKNVYYLIGELNGKTIIRGSTGDGEVWCIDGGKASLLNDEAKKVWVNEGNVTIMNKGGNIIIYTALGNS